MADYYTILGVAWNATPDEIRLAYMEAARRLHPDVNPDPQAHEKFIVLQQAYEVLSSIQRRVEYDATLPAEFRFTPKIDYSLSYSRSAIPGITERQLVYALMNLACTVEMDWEKTPPVSLCLVIDRSTSMQGERMDMVKASISRLVKQMRPRDYFSLVVFSDRAEVLIPLVRMADHPPVDNRVSLIRTFGGTEIFQGLSTGLEQLRHTIDPRVTRHLILLTDGHTYGDEEKCLALAADAAKEGVVINTLGVGSEWNDQFLDSLSIPTGGSSTFIRYPKDLDDYFLRLVGTAQLIYARHMKYSFHSGPGVELTYAFRLMPDASPLSVTRQPPREMNEIPTLEIQLGDLAYQHEVRVLLEFSIPPLGLNEQQIHMAIGQLSMDVPFEKVTTARIGVRIERVVKYEMEDEMPPEEVMNALEQLSLYRLQEKVQREISEGRIEKATHHLQHLAVNLLSRGQRELAHTVLIEADHLQKEQQISQDGEKKIKYGTRALLLPPGDERIRP